MQIFYPATIFATAIIYLMAATLLFMRRKDGERSRVILAVIVSLSFLSYTFRFISVIDGHVPALVVSVSMLLLLLVMVVSYIMYPIEVVSPGWLNFRRVLLLYSPVLGLALLWLLTIWAGVEYTAYDSLLTMLPHALEFDTGFRLLLCLLAFAPLGVIFFVPYTRRYNNTNRAWMHKYSVIFTTNSVAYIVVLCTDNIIINTTYYYVSVGCSLWIAYIELFERLIGKPVDTGMAKEKPITAPVARQVLETKNSAVFLRLEKYMHDTKAWRDPDLKMTHVVHEIYTNRTTMAQAIQEQGYDNYTTYVNSLRVTDFMDIMKGDMAENLQNAFFDAGFRSRSTAHRNFRLMTGYSPTEYFNKLH